MNVKKSVSLKGLFFRELYLGRKTYLSFIILVAVYGVVFSLVLLSMRIGNLALMEDIEETREGMELILMYFNAAMCAMLGMAGVEVTHLDLNTKWLGYIYGSPVKEEKYIAIKYIISFFFLLVGAVISVLFGLLFCRIHGTEFTAGNLAAITCIITVAAMGISCFMTLTFLFRNINTAAMVFSGIALVFFLGLVIYCIENSITKLRIRDMSDTLMSLCKTIAPFTPLIIIAVLFTGYFLSVKFAKRRYK